MRDSVSKSVSDSTALDGMVLICLLSQRRPTCKAERNIGYDHKRVFLCPLVRQLQCYTNRHVLAASQLHPVIAGRTLRTTRCHGDDTCQNSVRDIS